MPQIYGNFVCFYAKYHLIFSAYMQREAVLAYSETVFLGAMSLHPNT